MSATDFDKSLLEPKEVVEVITVSGDPEFERFIETDARGLTIVPEPWKDYPEPVLPPDAGDFAKWLRANATSVSVRVAETDKRLVLHSAEIWLGLAFLASDVSVQIYLNMVANYLYDRLKGALKGETSRVHFSVEYEETPNGGVIKRFNFAGDVDALKKVIKRFDLNRFLDD
jgi:hypothetical protein